MVLFLGIFLLFGSMSKAEACTAFSTVSVGKNGPVIAKSFDWDSPDGLVIVNKIGIKKTAAFMPNAKHCNDYSPSLYDTSSGVLEWTSKHSSLTVNYFGRELPNSGMNSAGIVAEALVFGDKHKKITYPSRCESLDKDSITNLQFVQYILDTAGSLNDVIKSVKKIAIRPPEIGALSLDFLPMVHYLICDKHGECVVIEPHMKKLWVSPKLKWGDNGEVVFGKLSDLKGMTYEYKNKYKDIPQKKYYDPGDRLLPLVPVLANDPYFVHVQDLAEREGYCQNGDECTKPIGMKTPSGKESYQRFLKASFASHKGADHIRKIILKPEPPHWGTVMQTPIEYGRDALADPVCHKNNTVWNIVYEPQSKEVHWAVVDSKCKVKKKQHKDLSSLKHKNKYCSPNLIGNDYSAKVKDLNSSLGGKYDKWKDYTDSMNINLLKKALGHMSKRQGWSLPKAVISSAAFEVTESIRSTSSHCVRK